MNLTEIKSQIADKTNELKFLNKACKIPAGRKAKGSNPTCVVVDDLSDSN